MIYYRTKDNEVIDWICWKHYGTEVGTVETVLECNTELAEYGSFLAAGVLIKLPDIPKNKQKQTVKLWD